MPLQIGVLILSRITWFGLILSLAVGVQAESYVNHPDYPAFVQKMTTEHGFDKAQLDQIFVAAERKDSILAAISRPAERTLTWGEYRKIFLTPQRVAGGLTFWNRHRSALERAAQKFGVPPEIIVAIIGVETRYGGNMGSYRVVDALATLGFDYPPRAKFFLGELEHYLLLTREQGFDPLHLKGSYAGAMGLGQFIPSSYRAYAFDFDESGQADIWSNPVDAIGSVANYFSMHGWKQNQPVTQLASPKPVVDDSVTNTSLKPALNAEQLISAGLNVPEDGGEGELYTAMKLETDDGIEYWLGRHNFYVITRYNHSRLYAMAVYQLSQEIAAAMAAGEA